VAPAGWAYSGSGVPTGSMTCAGITGLTLCAAALRAQNKAPRKQLDEMQAAILGGFSWLARHFTVRVLTGSERSGAHGAVERRPSDRREQPRGQDR